MRTLFRGIAGRTEARDLLWSVRNVSFEVARAERIGIVGDNGAGKTTLLSLIAGVLAPSEGSVTVQGQVAPLLGLGVGFHADMTGRECVRANGILLGMDPDEVERRMNDVLAFAELTEFADTPSRFYSSGMVARLGFAIATAMEPDLMIVDEALAVGDEHFQKKCVARLEALHDGGTAFLLVSHQLDVVEEFCQRVIWLDGGKIVRDGAPAEVLAAYKGSGA